MKRADQLQSDSRSDGRRAPPTPTSPRCPTNVYSTIATGKSERLAPRLRALRFRVAREVGNVQRQRRPVTHHRRQRRKKHARETRRVEWNWLGVESIVPKLPALMRTQISSAAAITNMNGAPNACRCRIDSTPRHTTTMFSSQKPRKHAHSTPLFACHCRPDHGQHRVNRAFRQSTTECRTSRTPQPRAESPAGSRRARRTARE